MKTAALAVLLSVALLPSTAQSQDRRAAEALRRVPAWQNSVVAISVDCGHANGPFFGSGVVVSPGGLVLTAGHVGRDCLNVTTAMVGALRSPYAAPAMTLSARLVARRVNGTDNPDSSVVLNAREEDLALWQIENFNSTSGLRPATLATRFPAPGDAVTIAGFSRLPYRWLNFNHPRQAGLTLNRLNLISVAAHANDVPFRLHYAGTTLAGVSGGPVFDEEGRLIGIHSGRATDDIFNLLSTTCDPSSSGGSCMTVSVPAANGGTATGAIGVNLGSVKEILENYSWATSIHALPADWRSRLAAR